MAKEKTAPPIAVNRQAHHNYFIHETYECGIALTGTEVKSIRSGKANLRDSFAKVQKGEVFLWNAHISPYEQGNIFNHDPLRTRKLLLHKKEILKIENAIIFQHIPARDIVSHSNCRFGKRRQKICLIDCAFSLLLHQVALN